MMPPSLCHYSLDGKDRTKNEEVVKIYSLLEYGDDEVRVSCVWEGRTSSMASEV